MGNHKRRGNMVSDKLKTLLNQGSDHYKTNIEPIEFITANNLGFIEGNIIKYIHRYKKKNKLDDLKKAEHYLKILMATEYNYLEKDNE